MTREEAIHFAVCLKNNWTIDFNDMEEFCDMAIEALGALSEDAIAKAYSRGFIEGSVNATVNSNYVCPRCGKTTEHDRSHKKEVVLCSDCIANNDGNLCTVAAYINEDGDGFCNCGERRKP